MALQSNYEQQVAWLEASKECGWGAVYSYGFNGESANLWKKENENWIASSVSAAATHSSKDTSFPRLSLHAFEMLRQSVLKAPLEPQNQRQTAVKAERVDVLGALMQKVKENRTAQNQHPPRMEFNQPFEANDLAEARTTPNFASENASTAQKYRYKVHSGDYNVWDGEVAMNVKDQDWQKEFEWHYKILKANRETFGNQSFRAKQLEVINAVMSQRDVFVMMPTGGGKSLCFQLPAVVSPGLTVVILPLLSLMQDQVDQMTVLNIKARALFAAQSQETQNQIYNEIENNEGIKLLYVTPEKIISSPKLISVLHGLNKAAKLDRFAIDEVHCVSQWGNDFRSQYCELKKLRTEFANVPIIGLTASATVDVLEDVVAQLGMIEPVLFQLSFNRPNLCYEVYSKTKVRIAEDISKIIKSQFKNVSGIVYCLSKKECEKMAEELQKEGIKADFYHADVDAEKREEIQRDWMNDSVQVIVATVAFGMGINKKDVRFVIHSAMPKSLENYYQESGRAGRDGEKATCIIYYDYYDKQRQQHLIQLSDYESKGENYLKQKKKNEVNLLAMLNFCEEKVECRRTLILKYFGEAFTGTCNAMCDTCRDREKYGIVEKSCETAVGQIISFIKECKQKRLDSGLTLIALKDVLLGKKSKRLKHMEKLTNYACLRKSNWTAELTIHLLHEMIIHQVLHERCFSSQSMFGTFSSYVDVGKHGNNHSLRSIRYFNKSKVPSPPIQNESVANRFKIYEYTLDKSHDSDVSPDLSVTAHSAHSPIEIYPQAGKKGNKRTSRNSHNSNVEEPDKSNHNNIKRQRLSNSGTANTNRLQDTSYPTINHTANRGTLLPSPFRSSLRSQLQELRRLLSIENNLKNASSIVTMEGIDEFIDLLPTTTYSLKKRNLRWMNTATKIERYGRRFVEAIRQFLLANNFPHLVEEDHIGGQTDQKMVSDTKFGNNTEDYICVGGLHSKRNSENAHENYFPTITSSTLMNRNKPQKVDFGLRHPLEIKNHHPVGDQPVSLFRENYRNDAALTNTTVPCLDHCDDLLDIIKQLDVV